MDEIIELICKKEPTFVAAVKLTGDKIVRCRDCAYRGDGEEVDDVNYCYHWCAAVKLNDFCSHAERCEDNEHKEV